MFPTAAILRKPTLSEKESTAVSFFLFPLINLGTQIGRPDPSAIKIGILFVGNCIEKNCITQHCALLALCPQRQILSSKCVCWDLRHLQQKHRNLSFWRQKCSDWGLGMMTKDWGLRTLWPKKSSQIDKSKQHLGKGFSFAFVFEHDKIFEHNVNNFPRWELNSAGKHPNLN